MQEEKFITFAIQSKFGVFNHVACVTADRLFRIPYFEDKYKGKFLQLFEEDTARNGKLFAAAFVAGNKTRFEARLGYIPEFNHDRTTFKKSNAALPKVRRARARFAEVCS